jgi:HNH endonuclease
VHPTRVIVAAVYADDHYHCQDCGEKVILTPVMRLLGRLYPEQFPYHAYWKAASTHPAFLSRSAALDHIVPVAGGGDPLARSNLVTACWGCNRRKGDLTLDEIGWSLVGPPDTTWTGLWCCEPAARLMLLMADEGTAVRRQCSKPLA